MYFRDFYEEYIIYITIERSNIYINLKRVGIGGGGSICLPVSMSNMNSERIIECIRKYIKLIEDILEIRAFGAGPVKTAVFTD